MTSSRHYQETCTLQSGTGFEIDKTGQELSNSLERDPPCLSWRQRKKEEKKNNTHIPDVFVCCCCCTVGKCSNLPPPFLFLVVYIGSARRTHTHSVRRKLRNNKQQKMKLSFVICLLPWRHVQSDETPQGSPPPSLFFLNLFFKFLKI